MRALFAGTFDPPTLGHADIIERASALFDLTVAVARNGEKQSELFSVDERVGMLEKISPKDVHVTTFAGLVSEFAKKFDLLIRGVRSGADIDHELRMAASNRALCGVETLLLPADGAVAHVSATLVREIGAEGGDLTKFVPSGISGQILARLR